MAAFERSFVRVQLQQTSPPGSHARTLATLRFGPPKTPKSPDGCERPETDEVPVVCVHGLSANAVGFAPLARHLAARGRTTVAVDLRGRGRSPCTGAGTYGWVAHAKDVLEVAASLAPTSGPNSGRFDLVGHSMGAFVALQAAQLGARIRKLVLIDGIGLPEPAAMPPILAAVQRLGAASYPSLEDYVGRVRALGTIEPWSQDWVEYFRYETEETAHGIRPRTSSAAVLEDVFYGSTQDPRSFWSAVRTPALLVRAGRPLGTTRGFIVSATDRDAFVRRVQGSRAIDIDANHYGVLMHQGTLDAIGSFLQ